MSLINPSDGDTTRHPHLPHPHSLPQQTCARSVSRRRWSRSPQRGCFHWALAILVALTSGHVALGEEGKEIDDLALAFFESRIRPVLVEHCHACHSAAAAAEQKLQGGLQVDSRKGLLEGGDLGPAIIPGQPADSLLLLALRHESGLEMPPDGMLPENVIADFERWITMGAPDPRREVPANQATVNNQATPAASAKSHWAFQPPRAHARPAVQDESWPQVEADYFVLAQLDQLGLRPVPAADKPQLLRRITFDLIGLPPTLEEVEAFVRDETPQALDVVLDRLLASPHYGERWGRFWLDIARYADDKALAYHNPWPHAYRYRDWVVEALNRDVPYDQFLALQLAADLIPEYAEQYSQLSALGFQGLGAIYHKGNFPKQVMADELDDRIDTLTRGLLGLTVACARCHDHKYDPVSTADYYSLAAAYNEAKWVELPLASPEVVERRQVWEAERKQQEEARNQWLAQSRIDVGRRELGKLDRYLTAFRQGGEEDSAVETDLHAFFVSRGQKLLEGADAATLAAPLARWVELARQLRPAINADTGVPSPTNEEAEDGEDEEKTQGKETSLPEPLLAATRALVTAVTGALNAHDEQQAKTEGKDEGKEPKKKEKEKEGEAETSLTDDEKLLLDQLWLAETGLFHLGEKQVSENQLAELLDANQIEQRASLAEELARHDAVAPLDPPRAHGVAGGGESLRVHIRGNVERLSEEAPPGFLPVLELPQSVGQDAGATFTRLDLAQAICTPKNPLTARVIVNRVWQQHFGEGIVRTPSNFGLLGAPPTHPELLDTLTVRFIESGWSLKWLHREILRSSTYQLSSGGDRTLDGTSTAAHRERDPSNRYLWKFSARRVDFESLRDSLLAVSGRLDRSLGGPAVGRAEAGHDRRTIYSTISRREPDKMLVTFDFPDPNVTAEGRNVTTVPQQQLFALNSEFMHEAARSLAGRVVEAAEQDQERIHLLYGWVLSRKPQPLEVEIAREFIDSIRETAAEDSLATTGATTNIDRADTDTETVTATDAWVQLAHALLAANEFVWVD